MNNNQQTNNGSNKSLLLQHVFVAVLAAMLTFIVTFAYAGVGTVSRADVERMVRESELRTSTSIIEMKSQQAQILEKLSAISEEQVRLSTKFDTAFRR